MNKKLSEIEMTFCNANNFRSQSKFREISLVERCLASRRTEVSRGLYVPSKFKTNISDTFCGMHYPAVHPFEAYFLVKALITVSCLVLRTLVNGMVYLDQTELRLEKF